MSPKVSIIILNWNGWKDTIECLESLYQIIYQNYDVILVDNGSEDESIEKIKGYCNGEFKVESKFFKYDSGNKPIKILEYARKEAEAGGGKEGKISYLPSNRKLILIKNEKNYGFAEGNNIGIRYPLKALKPDYILLLNNDTVVDKEFLGELVKVCENDKRVGIVGPKIYYYGCPIKIHFIGGLINYWIANWYVIGQDKIDMEQFEDIINVDWVNGCCFLASAKALIITGLLDNRFFMGYEDVDICIRMTKHNFKILAVLKSKIWHKIGVSRDKSKKSKKLSHYIKYFYYTFGTKLLLIKKHWRGVKFVTATLYLLLYIPFWLIRYFLKI